MHLRSRHALSVGPVLCVQPSNIRIVQANNDPPSPRHPEQLAARAFSVAGAPAAPSGATDST
eukprot:3315013-Heterocapsa_arctica.AAC.1